MRPKFTIAACQICGGPFRLKAYKAADPTRGKFCKPACYWQARKSMRRPLVERFWEKVDKNGPVPLHRPELGPCWIWLGVKGPKGYGRINTGGRDEPELIAPRAAWILTYGPILDSLWILHRCDNPPCVNPAHLFLGTAADNSTDMAKKGRSRAFLTEVQAVEILRRFTTNKSTQTQLAREFGVSIDVVHALVRRKTWKHLVI